MSVFNRFGDREWAILIWLLFTFFVLLNRSLSPVDHADVFLIYRDAASLWLRGHLLYDGSGTGFIYFPQSALLTVPFTFISP